MKRSATGFPPLSRPVNDCAIADRTLLTSSTPSTGPRVALDPRSASPSAAGARPRENVHCNDPTPATALPFGTTNGAIERLKRTTAIVAERSPAPAAA
jgi:hypothetical protein